MDMHTRKAKRFVGLGVRVLLALVFLLVTKADASAASTCGIGFLSGSTISAANIDGIRGTEWGDASLISSGDPCLDQLLDDGGTYGNVHIYSKRYSRTGQSYLALFIEVEDSSDSCSSPSCPGGLLLNGERIILQFDPNGSGGTQLENGAGALNKDYRLVITHKWESSAADANVVDNVTVQVYDGSFTGGICPHGLPMWAEITPSVAPTVVVRKDHPGGYKLELEIPLAIMGDPASDVGVALAIINDFGTCTSGVCDGYGVSIPNGLPVTNADNPVTGCMGSWIVPDDWGIGHFETPPANVWISRNPIWWSSEDIQAFACNSTTPDYAYYPDAPCGLRLEATLHNDGTTDQVRNLLFLWADHGASPANWRVVDLVEGITILPTGGTFSSSVWNGVPTGLPNHPCVRAYILPPTYEAAFDRTDILNISTPAQLAQMVSVYSIENPQWAQKNISIHGTLTTCPDESCQVGRLFDGQEPPPQLASVGEQQFPFWRRDLTGFRNSRHLRLNLSLGSYLNDKFRAKTCQVLSYRELLVGERSSFSNQSVLALFVLTALLAALAAWRLVAVLAGHQEAARQRISNLRLNWKHILWRGSIVVGLVAFLVIASCTPTKEPAPIPEPETGDTILLADKEMKLFGQDNVMVQVRSFGYSKPPAGDPPHYNFIENLGGVLQMFPTKMIQEQGKVLFQIDITNPGEVQRTIYLRADAHIPPGIDPKNLRIEIDTQPQVFKGGETRTVKGVVFLQERSEPKTFAPWLIALGALVVPAPILLWLRRRSASRGTHVAR